MSNNQTLKLANWNVALPIAVKRREGIRAYIDTVKADVWVFTEMHDECQTGIPYSHSSAPGRDGLHGLGHRWVTIASQYPVEPLNTSDPQRTAACRIFPPESSPFILYGTVLPWIGSEWRGFPSKGGIAFREALLTQKADWEHLISTYPNDELFVMGDFNQDLAGSRYYGSKSNRMLLESVLEETGLLALTGGNNDPVQRLSAPCACIDHICSKADSRWLLHETERWPDSPKPLRALSDHFGIAVTLVN